MNKAVFNRPQGHALASPSQSHKPEGGGLASPSQSHKKPVTKAKTARLAVVRKALTAQEAKYFTHPENRIAKTVQAVEPVRADFDKKELPQGYDKDLIVLQVRDP